MGILFSPIKYAILIPIKIFPFPFPLIAQNYSYSMGIPWESQGMGIPISMHTSSLWYSSMQVRHLADEQE